MKKRFPQVPPDDESSVRLREFLGKRGERRRRPPSISDREWALAQEQAGECIRSGRWGDAAPRHLVALYDLMHSRVYGVQCVELLPRDRAIFTFSAKRLLDREFDGVPGAMAEWMRWVWQREADRERRRRFEGRETSSRIGPRLMFGGALITDWRLSQMRRAASQ
jgi:hypothetical protein